MSRTQPISRSVLVLGLLAGSALIGCDSDIAGPGLEDPTTTVLVGQVRPSGAGGGTQASQQLSDIVVTVDGTSARDTTDANGTFRIETLSVDGSLTLRFQKGAMDVSLSLSGLNPGTVVRLDVSLDSNGATLDDSSSSSRGEFEGEASFSNISGSAPSRTLQLRVTRPGATLLVDVAEAGTVFEADGDLTNFDRLRARVEAGRQVRVEGDGALQEDGRVVAAIIKAETDEDDDDNDNDDEDFEGRVTTLTLTGAAPDRSARVVLVESGRQYAVDISESSTTFQQDGDLDSFDELLSAHDNAQAIEIEGDGIQQSDGSFIARSIKVETEDDDSADDRDDSFEGALQTLDVSGTAPNRIAEATIDDDGQKRYVLHITEGVTRFEQDGDLVSFEQLVRAHALGVALELDGDGALHSDGSYTVVELEVELEDNAGDEQEFKGDLTTLTVSESGGQRTVQLTLDDSGRQYVVDVVEGLSAFDADGDLLTIDQLIAAYDTGRALEIEGVGTAQPTGALLAWRLEVEVDD